MKAELLNITKHVIFKYITQEQIFERYIGETVDLSVHYTNPYRKDKKPGCSYYYREGTNKLIFHDFAWGVHWDCFDVVMHAYSLNYAQALEKVAVDFDLIESKTKYTKIVQYEIQTKEKIPNKIQIKRKEYLQKELNFWNIGGLTVTKQELLDDRIFSISDFWETIDDRTNHYYKQEMTFAYQFGVETFQIYSPLKERRRRKFINPFNFIMGDTKKIDFKASYLIITKSKKDSFLLRKLGFNACFIIHEGARLTDKHIEIIKKFPIVFTLFDNDLAGIRASRRFKNDYGTIPLWYRREFINGKLVKDTYDNLKQFSTMYIYEQAAMLKMEYNL